MIQFAVSESGTAPIHQLLLPYMELSAGRMVYDIVVEEAMNLPALDGPRPDMIVLPTPSGQCVKCERAPRISSRPCAGFHG